MVNRGTMLKLAKQGKLLAKTNFYFGADEITQVYETKDSKWLPVKITSNNNEWEEGYYNMKEWDFKTKSGSLWKNSDGTYTLYIHSNDIVKLKIKQGV